MAAVPTGRSARPATGLEPAALRRCFGRFQTGVTVVTYATGDGPRGVTVNSFTSVSLDPPLILLSLARTTNACAALATRPFTVNVLRADQTRLALQFAGRAQAGLSIEWAAGDPDAPPAVAGAVATLTCRPWRRYDGGDHVLQLGEVTRAEIGSGDPLVFGDGRFLSTGLPLLDGPLGLGVAGPSRPRWAAAAHRLHSVQEVG